MAAGAARGRWSVMSEANSALIFCRHTLTARWTQRGHYDANTQWLHHRHSTAVVRYSQQQPDHQSNRLCERAVLRLALCVDSYDIDSRASFCGRLWSWSVSTHNEGVSSCQCYVRCVPYFRQCGRVLVQRF